MPTPETALLPVLERLKHLVTEHLPKPPSIKSVLGNPARFVLKPAEVTPFGLQAHVIRQVLEAGFAEAIEDGDFDCLINQWIEISLTDVALSWCFSLTETREILIEKQRTSVTQIRGDAIAFALIAGGKVDPDTLFFQRRIVITGDTELGHEVKNLLDGLDKTALPPTLQRLLDQGAEAASHWEKWRKELAEALLSAPGGARL